MQAMTAPTAPRPTLTRPAARNEPPEADDDPEMAVVSLSAVLIVVIGANSWGVLGSAAHDKSRKAARRGPPVTRVPSTYTDKIRTTAAATVAAKMTAAGSEPLASPAQM
jgi:hypothetical protein